MTKIILLFILLVLCNVCNSVEGSSVAENSTLKVVEGKSECVACKLIYGAIVTAVKFQNASIAELEKISKEICDMHILNFTAPKAVKAVCSYVLQDITKIRVAIVNGISSDKFCKNAKFCDDDTRSTNSATLKVVEGKSECVACKLIYGAIVTAVKFQNASIAELEKISKEICDMHILNFTAPKAVKAVCSYVLQDITKIRVAIVNGISSDKFCKNAKFCDNASNMIFTNIYAGTESIVNIFSDFELKQCVRLRTPTLVRNPDTGGIHISVRCCGANRCSGKRRRLDEHDDIVGDNLKDCKVAMKSSYDNGTTWGKFQIISPKNNPGFGHGSALWDKIRKRIVLQYQSYPHGSTAPTADTTYYQIYSDDDARTWSPPTDISPFLKKCNPNNKDMMDLSAGNKIQTSSGRLLYTAHNHNRQVCTWYSDDGGLTYNTSNVIRGNEISVAPLNSGKGHLYMNGRGQSYKQFDGYRVDYFSYDDGATWSKPQKSKLYGDDGSYCERSLINFRGILYSAEPQGRSTEGERTKMVIQCSKDDAKTWNSSVVVNGEAEGGYSDLLGLPNGKLLMVWEYKPSGNVFAKQIDTKWCNGGV